ncbi:hypothetical protein SCHPADRAFT_840114 [Schizopora paradoxa]|uniref:Uncharacterized protein n=1 Tax=Schizopora paradoxa TaxID=27342 RepID=A0A0H2RJ66_9AGAM|nr:hypothetical protein SCHPADRAFT_840114 [Schizopora paradoxa]
MPSAQLLAHLRRELFHGGWDILLDEEFLQAYCYGKLILCADGITRRVFPRIFIYSADYPEKCLIGTIRDMGDHPCPRCLISKSDIHLLGSKKDAKNRKILRTDDAKRQDKITTCRKFIYEDGYVVNSKAVENILKEESWVPTKNSFSKLSARGLDVFKILVPDFMHEVEIGLHKNLLIHLVRILNSTDAPRGCVIEFDTRFASVPVFGHSTIRGFKDNTSDMQKLAARDYEDMILCIIPCFEGLLDEPDNSIILNMLYTMCQFHSIAKLQMHTEETVGRLRKVITTLGNDLRTFQLEVCVKYETFETSSEVQARGRADMRRAALRARNAAREGDTINPHDKLPQIAANASSGGRLPKRLNLNTYKLHSIVDYPDTIVRVGPLDIGSTQPGEHEHKHVKTRYRQSSKHEAQGQMAKKDVYERELRRRAHELREIGYQLPTKGKDGTITTSSSIPSRNPEDFLVHTEVAKNRKGHTALSSLLRGRETDPAFEEFMPRLRAHVLGQISGKDDVDEDMDFEAADLNRLVFVGDCLYAHPKARINYTTYDLRSDKDIVKPSSNKCYILVACGEDISEQRKNTDLPFWYAQVLGIYHAIVTHSARNVWKQRVEFLHVRWFGIDPDWKAGDKTKRLDQIGFVPCGSETEAFGFVGLSHVIRACHLIPAFAHGKTSTLLRPLEPQTDDSELEWRNYYVNKFVDRDMYMRYTGLGVGHVASNSSVLTNSVEDEDSEEELEDEDVGVEDSVPNSNDESPVTERDLRQDLSSEDEDEEPGDQVARGEEIIYEDELDEESDEGIGGGSSSGSDDEGSRSDWEE